MEIVETRTIRRFAWLPVLAGVHWLWLEWYEAEQEWLDDASGMAGARWLTVARHATGSSR